MLTGVQPWCGNSVEEVHDSVVRKQEKPCIPSGLPPAIERVIIGCFVYDFRSRPSMKNILEAFKSSEKAVYNDGDWTRFGSRTITDNFIVNGYTEWFLSKENFLVGDLVRSRKPLQSSKPENVDVPIGTCTRAASDPPADVIHRASFLLQNGFGGYHIFRNNCEDFAIYCKTGLLVSASFSMGSSGQAASFSAASSLFSSSVGYLTSSFSVLALVGCATYCVRRILFDIGVRHDVTKVPVESFVAGFSIDKSVMAKEDSTTETGKEDFETEMGNQVSNAMQVQFSRVTGSLLLLMLPA